MSPKITISILVFVFFLFLFLEEVQGIGQPVAEKGELNIQQFDFNSSRPLPLKGEWEFYWNQLIDPGQFDNPNLKPAYINMPAKWNDISLNQEAIGHIGYATYRLKLDLRSDRQLMALHIENVLSCYKVWINGKLLVEKGKVGKSKQSTVHNALPSTRSFIPGEGQEIEIVMQVANFFHKYGGIKKAPTLGSVEAIEKVNTRQVIGDILLSGSLLFIGLSFLFLSTIWKKDKVILYFSLFCLCWSYRAIAESYAPLMGLFPDVSWEVNSKIKYIMLYKGSLMGILFYFKIFGKKIRPKFIKAVSIVILIFILFTILLPNNSFTYLLNSFFGIMFITISYMAITILFSLKAKRKYTIYAVLSVISGTIVFITHILFYYYPYADGNIILNIAYMVFFLLTSMMLGVRFTNNFFKLEKLQTQTSEQREELSEQAQLLKHVNEKIATQKHLLEDRNEEIKTINGDLEIKVNERTAKLISINKELDLFLYRASHDLRRPISTVLGIDQVAKLTVQDKDALELFQRIQQTVQGMDMMLKKFIAISEVYNHNVTLHYFDQKIISQIIKKQASHFASIHDVKDFELTMDMPSSIYSDDFLINKIIAYLLENSFMFSPKIKEQKLRIQLKIFENGRKLKMILSDNGMGIKQELLDKIFNMYFIGNVRSKGNGLGLHVVRKAVEKLEGSISASSAKNEGSSFKIDLNELKRV